jgi:predicted DNA-binding transcriptional regulator AlpA
MSNRSAAQVAPILPRFIRAGEAYGYLGMCRDEFNKTVRPNVREFPIGKQGIGFDRIELDQWADAWVESMAIEKAANQDNNQPRSGRQGVNKWREKQSPASTRGTEFGTSTKSSEVSDFKKALEQAKGRKRSST